MKLRRRTAGFTLIEVLVVVAAFAALAVLLIPAIASAIEDARIATATATVRSIHGAILGLIRDTGRSPRQPTWPSALIPTSGFAVDGTGLNAPASGLLVSDGTYVNWRGPYLGGAITLDPWGRQFRVDWDYQVSARNVFPTASPGVAVLSYGPDPSGAGVPNANDIRQYFRPAF